MTELDWPNRGTKASVIPSMTGPNDTGRKSSRRKVTLLDSSRWIFNRMAEVYDARPPYPGPLVDAIVKLAGNGDKRVGDLGAGIGHLAIPLALRGLSVTAVEPACAMLERLEATAVKRGIQLRAVHAAAEALPLESQTLDLVLIADALHFIDADLAGREIARVLAPGGVLVVVTCELGSTPFMREILRVTHEVAQRKPRPMRSRHSLLAGVAGIPFREEQTFCDATLMTHSELDRILSSISFIGPAMNPERAAAFRARVHALTFDYPPLWTRKFTLKWGRRRPRQGQQTDTVPCQSGSISGKFAEDQPAGSRPLP